MTISKLKRIGATIVTVGLLLAAAVGQVAMDSGLWRTWAPL